MIVTRDWKLFVIFVIFVTCPVSSPGSPAQVKLLQAPSSVGQACSHSAVGNSTRYEARKLTRKIVQTKMFMCILYIGGMWYLTDTEQGLYNKTLFITLSEITTRTNYGTQIRLSCVSPLRAVEVACSSGLRQRDTWEYAAQPRPACTWAQWLSLRGNVGNAGGYRSSRDLQTLWFILLLVV